LIGEQGLGCRRVLGVAGVIVVAVTISRPG
jgi:hypothetical protein